MALTDTLKSIAAGGTIADNDVFVEITTAAGDGEMGTHITLINGLTTSAVAIGEDVVIFVHDGSDGYLYLLIGIVRRHCRRPRFDLDRRTGVTDIADGDLVSG